MNTTTTAAHATTIVLENSQGYGTAVTVDLDNSTFVVRSWDDENPENNWVHRFDNIEAVDECLAHNLAPSLSSNQEYQNLVALDQAVAEWAKETVADLIQGMTTTTPLGTNNRGIAFAITHHPDGRFTVHSWNEEQLCGHWAAGFNNLFEVNEYLEQNQMPPLSGN